MRHDHSFKHIIFIAAATLTLTFGFAVTDCLACTAVYVGSKVSTDGTVIMARSNDSQHIWPNYVLVTPREENKPGRTMPVNANGEIRVDLPDTTYKYTATPFMDAKLTGEGGQRDAAVCANEYGVAMTMSVTAFANKAALDADPLVENGLIEDCIDDLVICQSKTAREAVQVLASIMDKYGTAESNIGLIADQNETWLFETYTGHQYAAVKLPDDKVAAFGNEYTLEYLSEYEESIKSPDLLTMPEKNGFAVYGKDHELCLCDTYAGPSITSDYSHMRTWIGHQILSPSKYGADYDHNARYPLCFEPDKKVGPEDVVAIMRNRYDGTGYSPDDTGRIDMRVIGTDTAMSVHMLQVYKDLPAEMSCVTWESVGPAIYGVFVPVSNAMTEVTSAYGLNQPGDEYGNFEIYKYPYYTYKELTTLCVEGKSSQVYGKPVRDYWKKAETGMFSGMQQVLSKATAMEDKTAAASYISEYCNTIQDRAFTDAKSLLNTVMFTQSKNSNTMKLGKNPETGRYDKTERKLDPMEVKLDASVYTKLPDEKDVQEVKKEEKTEEKTEETKEANETASSGNKYDYNMLLLIVGAVIVIRMLIFMFYRRK
ncbi:MAG: C69 family dipeptidase [Lachnospiraceae bacterium]|nr:C69 family dipeptidase [Lachnospiraceae bacterium]